MKQSSADYRHHKFRHEIDEILKMDGQGHKPPLTHKCTDKFHQLGLGCQGLR